VRIDPTFSDANWISMGGIPGVSGTVSAAVVDGAGNLYIAGVFTLVGDLFITNIAKWNGSSWSALGSGIGGVAFPALRALAVSSSDLYVGGPFTMAGRKISAYFAKARIASAAESITASGSSATIQGPCWFLCRGPNGPNRSRPRR
jgi:hypothetical protein